LAHDGTDTSQLNMRMAVVEWAQARWYFSIIHLRGTHDSVSAWRVGCVGWRGHARTQDGSAGSVLFSLETALLSFARATGTGTGSVLVVGVDGVNARAPGKERVGAFAGS
jgi:hypothetical protein